MAKYLLKCLNTLKCILEVFGVIFETNYVGSLYRSTIWSQKQNYEFHIWMKDIFYLASSTFLYTGYEIYPQAIIVLQIAAILLQCKISGNKLCRLKRLKTWVLTFSLVILCNRCLASTLIWFLDAKTLSLSEGSWDQNTQFQEHILKLKIYVFYCNCCVHKINPNFVFVLISFALLILIYLFE